MSGDRVYWHDGERTARVPADCLRAIVATARNVDRVQPATSVAVFTALALHANGDGAGARPKVDTISDLLDLSAAQVRRIITNVLVPAGVVEKEARVENGRKVGNTYRLTRPQAHTPIAPQGALPIAPESAVPQSRPEARLEEQTVEQPEEQTEGPDPIQERAREIVSKVWERKDPKPATPFIGCVKIAEALLRAGHDPQAIGRAMVAVPTISTRWVEAEIAKGGPAPSRRAPIDTNRDAPEGRIDL